MTPTPTRPLDEVVDLCPHLHQPQLTTRGTLYAALLAEGQPPAIAMGLALRAHAADGRPAHGPDDVRAWWADGPAALTGTPRPTLTG